MIYLQILLITFIAVFIIDIAHGDKFITGLFSLILLKKWKPFDMKPFSCSLCSSFWANLIFVICMNAFTVYTFAFICLCSFSTTIILNILYFIYDNIIKLTNKRL